MIFCISLTVAGSTDFKRNGSIIAFREIDLILSTDNTKLSSDSFICTLSALIFFSICSILLLCPSSPCNSFSFRLSRNSIDNTRCFRCIGVQFLHIYFIGALHSGLKQNYLIGSWPCPLMMQPTFPQN